MDNSEKIILEQQLSELLMALENSEFLTQTEVKNIEAEIKRIKKILKS